MKYTIYVEPYKFAGTSVRISVVKDLHDVIYEHAYENSVLVSELYNILKDKIFRLRCKKFRFYTTINEYELQKIKDIEVHTSPLIPNQSIVSNKIDGQSPFIVANRKQIFTHPRVRLEILIYRYNDLFKQAIIGSDRYYWPHCRLLENQQYRLYQINLFNFYTITTDTVVLALTYLIENTYNLTDLMRSKYLQMNPNELAETLAFEYISRMT